MQTRFEFSIDLMHPDEIQNISSDAHELSYIERLVRDADLSAYLSNPALSDSRFLGIDEGASSDGFPSDLSDIIVWNLPGHGKASPSDGWVKKAFVCENGDYVRPVYQACHKLTCPNCCYDKMTDISNNVVVKMDCARKRARDGKLRGWREYQHLVVSPPQWAYHFFTTREGFMMMRAIVRKICAEIGLLGGVVIFHPFRQDGIDLDLVPDDYVPDESNSLDSRVWRFSPHFHVVGFGFIRPASADFTDSHDGWIYKAIRTGKDKIKDSVGIFKTVRYAMTHAGIMTGSSNRYQSVVYVGLMNSRHQSTLGEVIISRPHTCPVCKGAVHTVAVGRDRVTDCGHHIERERYPVFFDNPRNVPRPDDEFLERFSVVEILGMGSSTISQNRIKQLIKQDKTILSITFKPTPHRKRRSDVYGSAQRADARADPDTDALL